MSAWASRVGAASALIGYVVFGWAVWLGTDGTYSHGPILAVALYLGVALMATGHALRCRRGSSTPDNG